jgi:hypothetical protein
MDRASGPLSAFTLNALPPTIQVGSLSLPVVAAPLTFLHQTYQDSTAQYSDDQRLARAEVVTAESIFINIASPIVGAGTVASIAVPTGGVGLAVSIPAFAAGYLTTDLALSTLANKINDDYIFPRIGTRYSGVQFYQGTPWNRCKENRVNNIKLMWEHLRQTISDMPTLLLAALPVFAGFAVGAWLVYVYKKPYSGQPIEVLAIKSIFFLWGCTGLPFMIRKEVFFLRGWPAIICGGLLTAFGWYLAIRI